VAATVAQTVEITIASLLTAATIARRLVPAPLRAFVDFIKTSAEHR
jgi:hypothetical protein